MFRRSLLKLHQKYRDRPMSLADACIVRMAEIYERHAVLTLDFDFTVYRKHGRVPLALIEPGAELAILTTGKASMRTK